MNVNGLPAATGLAQGQVGNTAADIRVVAIADGDKMYRFQFAVPRGGMSQMDAAFKRSAYSFRRISASEAQGFQPQRLRTIVARAGDTPESLAARLPFDSHKIERWEVLNGRSRRDPIRPGEVLKTVSA
ncbi:MAG: peptidase, partial [Alphaproteobacteria bacterium]|nr:peptidase [Alphaproteobacteria bacterium]